MDRLEEALKNADAAGDVEAARVLAAEIIKQRASKGPSYMETLKKNVTRPFEGGLNVEGFREGLANAKGVSRDLSRAEGGVRGFISEGMLTPAQDVVVGIGSLPNLALEKLPAWLSSELGGLIGGKTDVKPTELFPTFTGIQEFVTDKTGLSRNPAETRPGRVGQAAVTGAMATPTMPILGLLAGGLGETAGQATEGTPYEVPARLAASVFPFGGKAAYSALRPAPGVTIGKAVEELTPAQFDEVGRLISDANRAGTGLTTAEAIAQVTGNKRPLVAQRAVEEATTDTPSVRRLQQMMVDRPKANRAAFENAVPPVQTPLSEIAPRTQRAAGARVQAERDYTNALTDGLYKSAVDAPDALVPDSLWARIADDPGVLDAINKTRADKLGLGRGLDGLPDNHMKVLDRTKRFIDDLVEKPDSGRNSMAGARDVQKLITSAADEAFPDYAAARLIQTRRQGRVEGPLRRSPTGKVADEKTLAGQYRKVFGDPMEVSPDQVTQLVRDIAKADPQLADDFVHRYLTRIFNKINKPKTTKETAGSNVSNELRGDVEVAANVEAAVKALPDGAKRWTAFNKLLNVWEAQGRRLPGGSPTQVKQEFTRVQRDGFLPRVTSLVRGLSEKLGDARYSRRIESAADLLVMSPEELGRAMMRRSPVVAPAAAQFSVQQN